jgi:hypothetical protein
MRSFRATSREAGSIEQAISELKTLLRKANARTFGQIETAIAA